MRWRIAVVAAVITVVLVVLAYKANADTRTMTENGPVYIVEPADRDPRAGVLIYVHGHRSDRTTDWYVDSVWKKHELSRKFKASGSKAVLVVVASWDGKGKGVEWPNLNKLVEYLETRLGPISHVHAMGHSGAWKNLSYWARQKRLDHLTLLDSTYGGLKAFRDFGKTKILDIAVGKWGKPRSNAKVVLKGLPSCKVRLKDVAQSRCRVIAVEEKIRHSDWAAGEAMIEFMRRGYALALK